MIRYFLALMIVAIFFGCSDKKTPRGIIAPEKMQDVLWDYIRADIFTVDYIGVDSSKNLSVENAKLQKAIFEKYKITKEEFYNSYIYYQHNPDQMQVLLDSMISRKRRIPDAVSPPAEKMVMLVDSPMVKPDSNLILRNRFGRGRLDSTGRSKARNKRL